MKYSNNKNMSMQESQPITAIQQKYRYVPILIVFFLVLFSFGGPIVSVQFCIGYQISLLILVIVYVIIIINSLLNYRQETEKMISKYHKKEKQSKLRHLRDDPLADVQQQQNSEFLEQKNPLNFAFIINVFDYDEFQLTHILDSLSRHIKAKNQYLIFVVIDSNLLQNKQINVILQKMSRKFKILYFCPMVANYRKGNKANLSSKLLETKLHEESVDLNQLMIISFQANCWCPTAFVLEVQAYLKQNFHHINNTAFFAPSANSVNREQAPFVNRVYEIFNNIMKNTLCYNPTFFRFNTSNFCVSYNQLKQVEFFKLSANNREIPHLALQLFWNNPKNVRFIPIATPFNGYSYSKKTGFLSPIKKQFQQAFQESQKYCQFAYSCKHFLIDKKKTLNRNSTVFIQQYILFFVGISIPLLLMSIIFQILTSSIFDIDIKVFSLKIYAGMSLIAVAILIIMAILLEKTTNRAVMYFHGTANKKSSLIICLELVVFLPISSLIFMVPGFLREVYGIYRYNRGNIQQQVRIQYNAADILDQNY